MSDSRLSVSDQRPKFRKDLLTWFDAHKRDLPWREDRDPYRVWISEIMLQQTRVAAVVEYYKKFIRRFPSVEKLAAARESSVLATWSGLGYYRRARMLHAAAKQIVREHGGKIPCTFRDLQKLSGVGRYTAAAVASIAFDEPVAVVDGNVLRVLGRCHGRVLTVEECWRFAEGLLDRDRPGDFNQAMMELGATVCLPRQPLCLGCPVMDACAARGELAGQKRPSRQRQREVHYLLDLRDDSILLVQRPADASLMPGMWEVPEISRPRGNGQAVHILRHSITVTDYTVHVHEGPGPENILGQRIATARLQKLPLTGLTRKILRTAEII